MIISLVIVAGERGGEQVDPSRGNGRRELHLQREGLHRQRGGGCRPGAGHHSAPEPEEAGAGGEFRFIQGNKRIHWIFTYKWIHTASSSIHPNSIIYELNNNTEKQPSQSRVD